MKQDLPLELASHVRQVFFGGNWTSSNLKDMLAGISWDQATAKTAHPNSIAALVFHINYFIIAASKVLEGLPLDAHDRYSFDVPPIRSEEEWQQLVNQALTSAEKFAALIERLEANKLWEIFSDEKYGTYFRNIVGIIEHSHYHLGQIAVIKNLLIKQPALQ